MCGRLSRNLTVRFGIVAGNEPRFNCGPDLARRFRSGRNLITRLEPPNGSDRSQCGQNRRRRHQTEPGPAAPPPTLIPHQGLQFRRRHTIQNPPHRRLRALPRRLRRQRRHRHARNRPHRVNRLQRRNLHPRHRHRIKNRNRKRPPRHPATRKRGILQRSFKQTLELLFVGHQ